MSWSVMVCIVCVLAVWQKAGVRNGHGCMVKYFLEGSGDVLRSDVMPLEFGCFWVDGIAFSGVLASGNRGSVGLGKRSMIQIELLISNEGRFDSPCDETRDTSPLLVRCYKLHLEKRNR